ncbi:hypothetical protein BUE80_DR011060 [Diplocarpon rosae]|nr:hypothetical protein BUE80_DR011060 [Diplocarpon rosae]
MTRKPIIAVAGLACETSTFTRARTRAPAFHAQRGDEIFTKHTFLAPGTPLGRAAEWHGALIGHALPGGAVTPAAFDELAGELVARLARLVAVVEGPLDGLWLDIHGAMCVEGRDDSEVELLRRIRAVVGDDVRVAASMDLHGNVSRELLHQTDLITCYRTAPHVDVVATRIRACWNLVELVRRGAGPRSRRPYKAWVPIPILLPGEQTSTRMEPARRLYAAVPRVEATEGVIDAAVWVGYPWADEPRNRAAVVVTGWDEAAVSRGAEELARMFWEAREEFGFGAPTGSLGECLDAALGAGARHPTSSPTRATTRPPAGRAMCQFQRPAGPTVIYASLPGPEAIRVALAAGVGATVTVTAGAAVDHLPAGPVTMTGRVHAIRHGDPDAVVELVLQVGSVFAILTQLRKPYHHERDFTALHLQPRAAHIVVVKIGYLEPELDDMAADWMLGLTPGGVDQDLERLGHRRIRRPMWPWDKDFAPRPDLAARIIAPANEPLAGPDE